MRGGGGGAKKEEGGWGEGKGRERLQPNARITPCKTLIGRDMTRDAVFKATNSLAVKLASVYSCIPYQRTCF